MAYYGMDNLNFHEPRDEKWTPARSEGLSALALDIAVNQFEKVSDETTRKPTGRELYNSAVKIAQNILQYLYNEETYFLNFCREESGIPISDFSQQIQNHIIENEY